MTAQVNTWSKDTLDAISIRASDCELNIQGTDEDYVKLESDLKEKSSNEFWADSAGRWLEIQIPHDRHWHHTGLTLKLPKNKAWAVDIFSGRAEIKASDIQARLHIMTGKGDIKIEKLKGQLTVGSAHAGIHINHFVQTEIPEPPRQRQETPFPPDEINRGPGRGWLRWDEDDWRDWGEGMGRKNRPVGDGHGLVVQQFRREQNRQPGPGDQYSNNLRRRGSTGCRSERRRI